MFVGTVFIPHNEVRNLWADKALAGLAGLAGLQQQTHLLRLQDNMCGSQLGKRASQYEEQCQAPSVFVAGV
jgi:hypothetical protein